MKLKTLPVLIAVTLTGALSGCLNSYDEPPGQNSQGGGGDIAPLEQADYIASSVSELSAMIANAKEGEVVGLNYQAFSQTSATRFSTSDVQITIDKGIVLASSDEYGAISPYGEKQAVLTGNVCIDIPNEADGSQGIRISNIRFEQATIDSCGDDVSPDGSNSRSIINVGRVGNGNTPVTLDNLVFDGSGFSEPSTDPTAWIYSRGLVHIDSSAFLNKQASGGANSIVYLNCGSNRINGGSARESSPTISNSHFSLASTSGDVSGVVAGQFDGKACNVTVQDNDFDNFAVEITSTGADAKTFAPAAIVDGATDDIRHSGNTFNGGNGGNTGGDEDEKIEIPQLPTPNKYAINSTLQSVLNSAAEGDVIGLDGDFSGDDLASVVIDKSIKLVGAREADNTYTPAVFTGGSACIVIAADNVEIHNLRFHGVQGTCLDGGDASKDTSLINIGAGSSTQDGAGNSPGDIKPTNTVISKLVIDDSTRTAHSAPYHHVIVRGSADIIANEFKNKPAAELGTFINIRNDSSAHENSRVFANYFYNLNDGANYVAAITDNTVTHASETGSADIFAIQIGTSSSKQNYTTNTLIQGNLFDSNYGPRRLIRVRASENTLDGNTFIHSYGWISFEGGENNQFINNIVLANGFSSDSFGKYENQFRFIGKGDVVENNYFDKVAFSKTGNELGAIAIWEGGLEDSNDPTLRAPASVKNNTIIDSKQPFLVGKEGNCTDGSEASVIHFTNNLVNNPNVTGQQAYRDDCGLNAASTWTGDIYGLTSLTAHNKLDTLIGSGATVLGDGLADLEQNSQDLWMATSSGNAAGTGASNLTQLTQSDVGLAAK